MSISVIGAGAFGTALAISLARTGMAVSLWARDPNHAANMQNTRENTARLPGVALPDSITVTANISEALADTMLLAVPMQKMRDLLKSTPELNSRLLVACCKGVELETELGPVAVIRDCDPKATPAILTGPSFAADIARGLPTALTLAIADDSLGQSLQQALTTPNLRIYRTTDTIGAELGGALKNVIAIACGAAMGAGLGESARAALMTRGYAEVQRMAQALGARPDTLAGLSGFGDLTLTCTSDQSRNYRFGLSLGRDEPFDPQITVEGAATARAVKARAKHMNIDMPITAAVVGMIDHNLKITQAMEMLLSRPPKEE
ncbi:glycerol-3-phosphate dehydrogenase (NAD(P)+) [Shimia gijangensis]|uniref:Glycerol-3-phosphate dehydrogenase [NAD(P)+] n=1 Tax=Shimia gijangensis TaxID=1470563 RepID=A0A1M6MVL9_9RHOB|nr:NAD(P)H-dependent glycerol-3-phosphate dehydrogenase [Shimia gijangensis]SHJ87333.1 glycerol-3-phosphate dehydrogenase (NAD(P)+) [Shimia gijangensis]